MRIAIASDHGGFPLKSQLVELLRSMGHHVLDLGANQFEPHDDYADYAHHVGQAIQQNQADRGVILCGSGVGACIAANKHKGVRACLCHDTYSARQGVEHDDMNVLCLGARIIGSALAAELIKSFLSAAFIREERFVRRLEKVLAIERSECSART